MQSEFCFLVFESIPSVIDVKKYHGSVCKINQLKIKAAKMWSGSIVEYGNYFDDVSCNTRPPQTFMVPLNTRVQ